MTHEEFVTKMSNLRKSLAKAKGVEELTALQKEMRAVLSAPRTTS